MPPVLEQGFFKLAYEQYCEVVETLSAEASAEPADERQTWIEWARWMANHYQRTSSAVEGRNDYLTRLHHSGRGFSPQTLKVLTIIHNFHLKHCVAQLIAPD